MSRKSLKERFWEKVKRGGPDECWLWKGAVSSTGYGQVRVESRGAGAYRQEGTHRVAFALSRGVEIPSHLNVLHRCDVRTCCNPDHLYLGSDSDNVQDMIRKERHGRMKLSASLVQEIRHRYATKNVSHRDLAREYGVEHRTIGRIIRRERWGWVE